jgi:peptidyl-prolyl cis-trans isomerase C
MKKAIVAIVMLTFVFALPACAKKEEQKGTYLAKVGNVKITQADFEREFKNLPEFAQALFNGNEGREKFLDELVKKEMLYQEALKKGLDKNPEFVSKMNDIKKISLVGMLLEQVIEEKTKLTDEDIKNYYDRHREDFAPVSGIRASQIIVKTQSEAENILERLKKGEDFANIARQSSIDPGSAKNGGDLGFLSKSQMKPEFEAVATKLKVGEVSNAVKTGAGYLIVKVTDKKFEKPLEFEKVKGLIGQRLISDKQKEVFDSYLDEVRKGYKVDINREALSGISGEEKQEGSLVTPGN